MRAPDEIGAEVGGIEIEVKGSSRGGRKSLLVVLVPILVLACLTEGLAPSVPEAPRERPPALAGPTVLLRGATVLTGTGPALENADVLVAGDRIRAVGRALDAPADARVVDVSGRWLTPGLIDAHSHIGVYPMPQVPPHRDGNESSDPFTPDVRAEESFWPQDPAIRHALAGGVTAIHVLPGSANLVGGQGVTLLLLPRLSAAEMRLPGAPTTMKMACGENPKRVYGERGRAPKTRMGEAAMLRQRLAQAARYQEKPEEAVDYGKRALKAVLDGEILIQNHCYRADEMLVRMDLFAEFEVAPRAFHHAVEAYKIRERLAKAGIGVATWVDWWGVKLEIYDAVPAGVALLDRAGVRVAIHSDSSYDVQRLNQQAAKAMAAGRRAGLDVGPEQAIRWVTAHPAWLLGIDDQTGTLEPGKRADLVVWSGDPFSVYSRAERVFIGGQRVYERGAPGGEPVSDFELGLGGRP